MGQPAAEVFRVPVEIVSPKTKRLELVDPLTIHFSQESIRDTFQDGTTLEDFKESVRREGEVAVEGVPLIRVFVTVCQRKYITHDNRRLWCYRELAREGVLDRIPVEITGRDVPHWKRATGRGGAATEIRIRGGQKE